MSISLNMNTSKDAAEEARLLRRGLGLEYITLGWNVIGVVVVIWAALKANSVALAGFGLDSLVEIGASTVVVWELTGTGKNRAKKALRLIGAAFFALAVYILFQSARTLYLHVRPGTSPVGIAWLVLTLIAMLLLAAGKTRTGALLGNPVLQTEGRVTLVDAYLAGSTLLGLVLNALLGWWWADPLAGLVIVFYGFKEGRHAWAEGTEV
jgi:divalent metal cation (Fe/Co/Zn/Cd) transporter